jgi:hypothetical protein
MNAKTIGRWVVYEGRETEFIHLLTPLRTKRRAYDVGTDELCAFIPSLVSPRNLIYAFTRSTQCPRYTLRTSPRIYTRPFGKGHDDVTVPLPQKFWPCSKRTFQRKKNCRPGRSFSGGCSGYARKGLRPAAPFLQQKECSVRIEHGEPNSRGRQRRCQVVSSG